MLKLTYTEDSFSLERLDESLEDWVNTRIILAFRLATKIRVESSTASFLLPKESLLVDLEEAKENFVEVCSCDAEFVEVVLQGLWLTADADDEVGVFVTVLSQSTELLLQQRSQHSVSSYQSSVNS